MSGKPPVAWEPELGTRVGVMRAMAHLPTSNGSTVMPAMCSIL